MKTTPWLLVSLGLNVLLAGLILIEGRQQRRPPVQELVARDLTNRSLRRAAARLQPTPPTQPETVEVTEPFHWSRVESADYREYAANLRKIGCPEATVQDIIEADVLDLFDEKVKELVSPAVLRFWEYMPAHDELEALVREKGDQLDDLQKEEKALLEQLLGAREFRQSFAAQEGEIERIGQRRQVLDFLPTGKIEAVIGLEDRYKKLKQQINEQQPPLTNSERDAKVKVLQEQQEQELAQMLSPEEIAEYRLRGSGSAATLSALDGFQASPEELRSIIAIQEKSAGGDGQGQRQDALKALLGDDRFAQFERAQDSRYREIYQVVERLQLPAQVAADVFQMRAAAEDAAKQLKSDKSVAPDARTARLREVQAETEGSIARTLGTNAFGIYQQHAGEWIEQLSK